MLHMHVVNDLRLQELSIHNIQMFTEHMHQTEAIQLKAHYSPILQVVNDNPRWCFVH